MTAHPHVIAAVKTATFSEVAASLGMTRNAVAGIVFRHKNRSAPSPPRARDDASAWLAVVELLADGRPRTTTEIAARVQRAPSTVRRHLRRLVASGAAVRLTYGANQLPAIWQEAPE